MTLVRARPPSVPHCGIDSVIGDRSGVNISVEFMTRMNAYWFG